MYILFGKFEEFGAMVHLYVGLYSLMSLVFSAISLKRGNVDKAYNVAGASLATVIFGLILLVAGYVKFGGISALHLIEILGGIFLVMAINLFFWRRENIQLGRFIKNQIRRMMGYKYSLIFLLIFL